VADVGPNACGLVVVGYYRSITPGTHGVTSPITNAVNHEFMWTAALAPFLGRMYRFVMS